MAETSQTTTQGSASRAARRAARSTAANTAPVQVAPGTASAAAGEIRTVTDDNVTNPGTVAPGDAPFDTVDPNERVSSIPVQPGEQAIREGVVNAVLVNDSLPDAATVAANRVAGPTGVVPDGEQRIEEYEVAGPDGLPVKVRHNIDTGETSRA